MPEHKCPAPGCERGVPRSQLTCKHHWFKVPKPLRDELWTAYKGYGLGSQRHMAAVSAILEWFASDDYIAALEEAPEWTI